MDVLPWSDYFNVQQKIEATCRGATFNVYKAGPQEDEADLVLLLIHGAGTSGLSWALFSRELTKAVDYRCACIAPDLRGHGQTVTSNDQDLSMSTLVADMHAILEACAPSAVPVCVVGHSLGGAIATHLANELDPCRLKLLVMIDLSEGNAMSARKSLEKILQCRPNRFADMDEAIRFLLKSGQVRNAESARISAPGYFCPCDPEHADSERYILSHCQGDVLDERDEDAEGSGDGAPPREASDSRLPPTKSTFPAASKSPVRWRVQLCRTSQYWNDWFVGLSSRFLGLSVPKLLILSSLQKLDTELTIGQMRGQYQLNVFPQSGHALNEDMPQELAETIAAAIKRYHLLA